MVDMEVFLCCVFLGGFLFLWLWMRSVFKTISLEAIEKNAKSFQMLAELTLNPLKDSLQSLSSYSQELEKQRLSAYAGLFKQIDGLIASEKELRSETIRLAEALKSPQTRGSWGEVHLRRVVELSGLLNHCDFFEQKGFSSEGKTARPDLVIHLPSQRKIAVDAKAPLRAYLESADLEGERKKGKLKEHAQALRRHIKELSSKEYWKKFDADFEYVILFLPAEAFFSAALKVDPALIEVGAEQNVIIATPTTLIAILRSVAHGWKQESLSKKVADISKAGQELYERIGIFCEHLEKVGSHLGSAVDSYNKTLASLETRVLVSARKLKEMGSLLPPAPEVPPIEKIPRQNGIYSETTPK